MKGDTPSSRHKRTLPVLLLVSSSVVLCLIILDESRYRFPVTTMEQVRIVVERSRDARMRNYGTFSRGGYDRSVPKEWVVLLKKIPNYQELLSKLLLECCGGKGEHEADDIIYFFHICDLMAATGNKYFIDVLKEASGRTMYIRTAGAAARAIKILEGKARYPKCGLEALKWQVIETEGQPNFILKYKDLDEEGRRLYKGRFSTPCIAEEVWIYYDEDNFCDDTCYIYAWDKRGRICKIIEGASKFSKALIGHLKKNSRFED